MPEHRLTQTHLVPGLPSCTDAPADPSVRHATLHCWSICMCQVLGLERSGDSWQNCKELILRFISVILYSFAPGKNEVTVRANGYMPILNIYKTYKGNIWCHSYAASKAHLEILKWIASLDRQEWAALIADVNSATRRGESKPFCKLVRFSDMKRDLFCFFLSLPP